MSQLLFLFIQYIIKIILHYFRRNGYDTDTFGYFSEHEIEKITFPVSPFRKAGG